MPLVLRIFITIEQEKKCIQDCTLNPYTLYYNKECVKSCPSRYVNNNQYCELYLQLSIAPDNPNVLQSNLLKEEVMSSLSEYKNAAVSL